jgi:HAAS
MSGTALDQPAVRDYLRELDTALATLPAEQGRELREQIIAHLGDALRPGADHDEVAQVLSQLGTPGEIVAEAAPGPVPVPGLPAGTAGQRRRSPLSRLSLLRWRARTLIIAAAALVIAATGYGVAVATASSLQPGGASSWWYPRDSAREVDTAADGAAQSTVPIRSGQRQGFVITVYNPSNWTQTVLGPASGFISPGGPDVRIGVAGPNINVSRGGSGFRPLRYGLPGTIPPHQTRALRVLWRSTSCLAKGTSQGIDQLSLRVRVGLLTRTEAIMLNQGWYLSGPSYGHCV